MKIGALLLGALVLLASGCQSNPGDYAMAMTPLHQGNWMAIRYSPATGEAWSAQQGRWVPIRDDATLPRSDYVIELVANPQGGWGAVRLDTASGQSWSASKGEWVRISETP